MKVKDLVSILEKFDPNLKVVVFNGEFDNEVTSVEIKPYYHKDGEYYDDPEGKTKAVSLC
jgi:hypothetical protein